MWIISPLLHQGWQGDITAEEFIVAARRRFPGAQILQEDELSVGREQWTRAEMTLPDGAIVGLSRSSPEIGIEGPSSLVQIAECAAWFRQVVPASIPLTLAHESLEPPVVELAPGMDEDAILRALAEDDTS